MSENRHPAGTSVGGQWAPGSAGEIDLDDAFDDETPAPEPELPPGYDDAFDRYSPVSDEVRSAVAVAADEHRDFSDESGKTIDSEILRVSDLPDDLEYDKISVHVSEDGCVSARIEGALLDDEFDAMSARSSKFVDDMEDVSDWGEDSEEFDIHLTIPGSDFPGARDLHDAKDRYKKRQEIDRLVRSGDLPPWSVASGDDSLAHTAGKKLRSARGHLYAVDCLNSRREAVQDIDSAIEDVKEGRWNKDKPLSLDHEATSLTGLRGADVDRFNEAAGDYARSKSEYDDAQALSDEAHSLPEGRLRDYLLATRPEESYRVQTSKPRARVKKTEMRTYRPKAPIHSELDDASRKFESAQKRFASASQFENLRGALEDSRTQVADHVDQIPNLQAQADSTGWDRSWGEVPKRLGDK